MFYSYFLKFSSGCVVLKGKLSGRIIGECFTHVILFSTPFSDQISESFSKNRCAIYAYHPHWFRARRLWLPAFICFHSFRFSNLKKKPWPPSLRCIALSCYNMSLIRNKYPHLEKLLFSREVAAKAGSCYISQKSPRNCKADVINYGM